MSKTFPRSMLAFSAAFLLFAAVGCDDDDEINVMNPLPGDGPAIRVVHASPNAPDVDVYVAGNATPLFTGVGYGDTSPYANVSADTYTIELRGSGSSPTSPPAFTADVMIGADERITAVAAGLFGSSDPADGFNILALREMFADPAGGNAIVRIVHAGSDAPSVALDVGNDGTPEVTDFARFADTGAAGIELPAGTALQIGVWAGSPLARVTAFTTPQLPAGAELFVIATGLLSDLPRENTGFALLAVAETGSIGFIEQNPVVYALHGSPDAPAVDILLGGTATVLAGNLAFGDLSGPIQVPPDAYGLDFAAAGTQTVAASATTPALAPGERYLAIATGFLSPMMDEPVFQLLPLGDSFDLDETAPLLRVVHASPDAPAVDIGVVNGGGSVEALAPFSNLAFLDASAGAGSEVPVATLPIGVAAAGTTAPVAEFTVTTAPGLRAFAVAAGALTPAMDEEAFRLLIVDTTITPWTVASVMPN